MTAAAVSLAAVACSDDGESAGNVTDLMTVAAYTDGLEFGWMAVSGATGYEVEYASASGAETLRTGEPRIALADLMPDTEYSVRVRSVGENGPGAWIGPVKVRTAAFSVSLTSYNVLATEAKSPWEGRVQAVHDLIRKADHDPDVLCLQECGTNPVLSDMQQLLADEYDVHVVAVSTADPALIFWKRDKFEKTGAGYTNMLLGDPTYTSADFPTSRYAHFVKLREKSSGKEFLVYDIHIKTNGTSTSYQKLRYDCISALCPAARQRASEEGGIPVFILGDFNNYWNTVDNGVISAPAACASFGFVDSPTIARECINLNYKTSSVDLNGFAEPRDNGNYRIDYVFGYSSQPFGVSKYQTVIDFVDKATHRIATPVPSDHHPINAVFHLSYR